MGVLNCTRKKFKFARYPGVKSHCVNLRGTGVPYSVNG